MKSLDGGPTDRYAASWTVRLARRATGEFKCSRITRPAAVRQHVSASTHNHVIYTHVLNRGGGGVRRPAAALELRAPPPAPLRKRSYADL